MVLIYFTLTTIIIFFLITVVISLIRLVEARLSKKPYTISITNTEFGWIALFTCLVLIVIFTCKTNQDESELIKGIEVELYGVCADILLLFIAFHYFNNRSLNQKKIARLLEDLDDFRYWHSEESKYKIIGTLNRLQKEAYFEINFGKMDLSGNVEKRTILTKLTFKLANFSDTKLLYCSFIKFDIIDSKLYNTKFNYSKFLFCDFTNNLFTRVCFDNCNLTDVDMKGSTFEAVFFTNAILENVKFHNATFKSAYFDDAQVSDNFIDQLKEWKLKDYSVFEHYTLIKYKSNKPLSVHHLRHVLKETEKITSIEYQLDIENSWDLKEIIETMKQ